MRDDDLKVRIARKAPVALDIVMLELRPLYGASLPAFTAGAHIDMQIRPGLVRQYSLCNSPSENHRYVLGVLRDPQSRGGSIAVHEELQQGQVIVISPPRNNFPLSEAPHALLLAGGIGVTPLLAMAEQLATTGASFEMHYCTRSPQRMAFRERIHASAWAARVHEHFDDGAPSQKLDLPAVLDGQPPGTHLYVCGPGAFIDFVLSTAQARGWDPARLHFESFSAPPAEAADVPFEVQLASSGAVYTVPAGTSIVHVLAEQGVVIPTSCEMGVCATCATRVLAGEPDHRDQVLTPQERAVEHLMTPCCSRAKSPRLVLDL